MSRKLKRDCETCKHNTKSITQEPCYSCSADQRENWEPMKKEIEIEDAFKTFNIEEAKQRSAIKDSGNRTEFTTGAVRDMHEGKGRYDLLPWDAIHELAIHCAEGANIYGERNCEKGIPIHSLIDSAIRHLSCYVRGMDDEGHLAAAMWNIGFAIWMEINRPEMQDIPGRKK